MSNRTLVELNHDCCPHGATEMLRWVEAMAMYMRSGDRRELPNGVKFKWMRHHSEPDPMAGKGDPS